MNQAPLLLEKASENIHVSELLLKEGHSDIAASRAYYAMFYIAEALLFSKRLAFTSHSSVIAAYGKESAKTKLLSPEFHHYLKDAFETRQVGDYGVDIHVTDVKSSEMIDQAKLFLQAANAYLI
jgi:uncharacterized protein (UPF0332 family)